NEMHELAEKKKISYDSALSMALRIGQIGEGHTKVPGPDGKKGFGGMCFIKDTEAILGQLLETNKNSDIVKAVCKKNQELRPEAY
ncbi:hypothetical protein, partial [Klebsiella pneumoniae]|uniref:hypothetical protein n=1 Tax=Klebsiella pneumoniae TaxID=573 RepID=UPI00190FACDF